MNSGKDESVGNVMRSNNNDQIIILSNNIPSMIHLLVFFLFFQSNRPICSFSVTLAIENRAGQGRGRATVKKHIW